MAYFPAADQAPAQVSIDAVRDADVYLLIAGFRYGSPVVDSPEHSHTELEFAAASTAGIPRLVILIDEAAEGPADLFVDHEFGQRQQEFRVRLRNSGLVVATVHTADRLETEVLHALSASQPRRYRARLAEGDHSWTKISARLKNDRPKRPAKPVVDISRSPTSLERRLVGYYGDGACVVEGRNGIEIEWVALDRDVGNMSFSNLVPLSRRHRLRTAGHRSWQLGAPAADYRFSIDLTAESLLLQSRRHFHFGSPQLAFGCARLGECLSMRAAEDFEAEPDDGWAFLTQCMFYLPYRMDTELLEALLLRIGEWLRRMGHCPRNRWASLMLSIANLYQDLGEWGRAAKIYDTVLRSELTPITRAAVVRRTIVGGYFTSDGRASAIEAFKEVDEMRTPADFRLSVAIAKGWKAIEDDAPGSALRHLEPFDFDAETLETASDFSPHNRLELKLTQAAALASLGMKYDEQADVVSRIVHLMRDTRLRPVFTDQIAPVVLTPHLNEIITPLRSRMLATPALSRSMLVATQDLLEARVSDHSGRPTWVD